LGTIEDLETFETEHFEIVYQKPLKSSVKYIANEFEQSFKVLTSVFNWTPKGKIEVLYVDRMDDHNGSSSPIPHNRIVIYAGGPGFYSSIDSPGDYLHSTIIHELTHSITMDMRHGHKKVLTAIFGKVVPYDPVSILITLFSISPVALSPAWFLEGSAMWAETELTDGGRGRSTYSEMLFRSAVHDDALLPYSKWYLEQPDWPFGQAAYHYGMKFIKYINETSVTDNPVGRINDEVSRRFLFNVDNAVVDSENEEFDILASEMLEKEEEFQKGNIEKLKKNSITKTKAVSSRDLNIKQTIFAGDKLYMLPFDAGQRRTYLHEYDIKKGEQKRLSDFETFTTGHINSSPDGRYILYTMLNVFDSQNIFYEVRLLDMKEGESSLLTKEGRYREVAPSPDMKRLAAVSMRGGFSELYELQLNDEFEPIHQTLLVKMPFQESLSGVKYSPDGNSIVYVTANTSGSKLVIFDRQSKENKVLFVSKNRIEAPDWPPNGKELIFSYDKNGVFNLYTLPISGGEPTPLTNVIGGVFYPSFSKDGKKIAATAYDSKGFYSTVIDYAKTTYNGKELSKVTHNWKGNEKWRSQRLKLTSNDKFVIEQSVEKGIKESDDYNSFSGFRFDYWSPWFLGDKAGALISFSDTAGYQDVKLLAGAELEYSEEVGALNYSYSGFQTNITLYAARDVEKYARLLKDEDSNDYYDYSEMTDVYGLALSLPLYKVERQVYLEMGYEHREREFIPDAVEEYDGIDLELEPTDKDEVLIWARIDYFDGTAFSKSNSAEDGRFISIAGEYADKSLGSEIELKRYLTEWNEYIQNPWLDNNVLKLSVAYGEGEGDKFAQGMFQLGGMDSAIAYFVPGMTSSLGLRGYDSNFETGDRILKVAASYRFLLKDFSGGKEGGFPMYSRQLFAEVFSEAGRTWDDDERTTELKWIKSGGLEVNYAMRMLRFFYVSPGIGVAYAPDRKDKDPEDTDAVVYISIKGWTNF
ncbi:hypothetical protein ACFL2A_06935, partial [Thermodesulfobacteriota bacterium]